MIDRKKIRKRYIAFEVYSKRDINRREMDYAIQQFSKQLPEEMTMKPILTVFKYNRGIVLCSHIDKEKTIEMLRSIDVVGRERIEVEVRTLGTSGTIKGAKRYLL